MTPSLRGLVLGTVLLLDAALGAAALAQTATKPPHKPAPAAHPVAARPAATRSAATRPTPHPTIRPRQPVFVPPPPVIELDEIAAPANLPTVLDTASRDRYRRIFQAQAANQWAQADAEIAQEKDRTLMGYVLAQRLLNPAYQARYDQLAAWLQDYNDHPDAPAVYRLAVARRPAGAGDLTPASFVSQSMGSPAFAAARTVNGADAGQAAAMRAQLSQMIDDGGYNAALVLLDRKATADLLGPQETEMWRGRVRTRSLQADSQRGLQVGVDPGMPADAEWSAAMAAFTSGNMAEAARRFELVADAPPDQASSWMLAAGSFWAARANLLAGNPQKFAPYLKRAALYNRTFHGLVAQKALGMRIEVDWTVPPLDRQQSEMLRNDRVGKRALALLQLGAATAAERELYAGSVDADPRFIDTVLSLANTASLPALSVRVGNSAWDKRHKLRNYDAAMYPIPPWSPSEGYLIDRALIYAFMRQESAFNPKARSYVGAMGLMQLMPGTARIVSTKYAPELAGTNPYDPAINMSLGQQYINSLLGEVDNNLVRTMAGYNGGPGNVARWDNSLNASQDPLLYIALIPLTETRDFVQRVMANYWMYQIRLGEPTPSLDQIAAHEWPRYQAQDARR